MSYKHFERVALTTSQLQDKLVLEIGAGSARAAQQAHKDGIRIIATDIDRDNITHTENALQVVVTAAGELAFQDNTFDLVISQGSVPIISTYAPAVEQYINEAKRVLKSGGEFRFGPAPFSPEIFLPEHILSSNDCRRLNQDPLFNRLLEAHDGDIHRAIRSRISIDRNGREINDEMSRKIKKGVEIASWQFVQALDKTARKRYFYDPIFQRIRYCYSVRKLEGKNLWATMDSNH